MISLKRYKTRKEAVAALEAAAQMRPDLKWILAEARSWDGSAFWAYAHETQAEHTAWENWIKEEVEAMRS